MTDDNLRHREKILPMEKAQSLKMQVEAISHQGTKMEGVAAGDVGKRSTEIVGERNGMNYKQVQRYIRLTELVPELQSMVNEKKLSFFILFLRAYSYLSILQTGIYWQYST